MIYQFIVNPYNNQLVDINSFLGGKILEKYINSLNGGSEESNLLKCNNKKGAHLNSGGFKEVFITKCNKKSWQEEVLKFNSNFSKNNCENSIIALTKESKKEFIKELEIQELSGSPKIYRYGKCNNSNLMYKIEERLDKDLYNLIQENSIWLQKENFKRKFKQLIVQVKKLHDKGYGHFDIKPDNIMVKLNKTNKNIKYLRLIDYGFTKKIPCKMMEGTRGYLDTSTYPKNAKTDIFALGITLLESLFLDNVILIKAKSTPKGLKLNSVPKSNETPIEWIKRTYKNTKLSNQIPFFKKYPITTHLIYKMILFDKTSRNRYNSRNRYTIDKILKHSFWNIDMEDELDNWKESPEFADIIKIKELRENQRNERKKREQNQLEFEKNNNRNKRNQNRAKYGISKRGDNCVCLGRCAHQNILDCIAGICSFTKKCPVDPVYCNGKKLDRC